MPEYAAKGRFHKGGGNSGLRAMGIARLVSLPGVGSGDKPKQVCLRFERSPLLSGVGALMPDGVATLLGTGAESQPSSRCCMNCCHMDMVQHASGCIIRCHQPWPGTVML